LRGPRRDDDADDDIISLFCYGPITGRLDRALSTGRPAETQASWGHHRGQGKVFTNQGRKEVPGFIAASQM